MNLIFKRIADILILAAMLANAVAQESGNESRTMLNLPDTGQTGDYTSVFGEDSDYTIYPPAFTDNGDGTMLDNVTGLLWQKVDGGEMTWEDACEYSDTLHLSGFEDWRLPSSHELFSIVDHGRLNPAINTNFFSITEAEYWWTDTGRADDPARIWVVNAGGGIGAHPKNETISAGGSKRFHMRCVRSVFVDSVDHFSNNGDSTITDNFTGLTWHIGESISPMTWEQALNYCETKSAAGFDDWRLPNIKELRSINADGLFKPSVDRTYFSNITASRYWSSTTEINNPSRAWFVDFNYGLVSYEIKSNPCYVFCVRGGNNGSTKVNKASDFSSQPEEFAIKPNYPNPFNPGTTIMFELNRGAQVLIRIFTQRGQFIKELLIGEQEIGNHSVYWNAEGLPSGLYFIQFKTGQMEKVQKAILLN